MSRNIAFYEVEKWEENYFSERLKGKLFFSKKPINKRTVKNVEAISIFIYSVVNKEILDQMPKLKLIVTRSTGFDHIDMYECKKRGIVVCND